MFTLGCPMMCKSSLTVTNIAILLSYDLFYVGNVGPRKNSQILPQIV